MVETGDILFAEIPEGEEFRFPKFHTNYSPTYVKTGYRMYESLSGTQFTLSTPYVMVISPV
jgi:hypothetical protein